MHYRPPPPPPPYDFFLPRTSVYHREQVQKTTTILKHNAKSMKNITNTKSFHRESP